MKRERIARLHRRRDQLEEKLYYKRDLRQKILEEIKDIEDELDALFEELGLVDE